MRYDKFILLFGMFLFIIGMSEWKTAAVESDADSMRCNIYCLFRAYPDTLKDVSLCNDGRVMFTTSNGTQLLYDDGKTKNIEQQLTNTDLQDMLSLNYPLEESKNLPVLNQDPGRARNEALLAAVYGKNQKQVEANLVPVPVIGGTLLFNSKNGAANALKQVMVTLRRLVVSNPNLAKYVVPFSGTYNYRKIAGTGRLSPHAFGIAIDLARNPDDYWRWTSREKGDKRVSGYPVEIVNAFEENGFVWGGKWGHFDILHFEYRPEILMKSRIVSSNNGSTTWYNGIDQKDPVADQLIKKINAAFDNNMSLLKSRIRQMVEMRNNVLLTGEAEILEQLYDTRTTYGQWALEHELQKMNYIRTWSAKQGVKFTKINPVTKIRSLKITGNSARASFLCATEYTYVYNGDAKMENRSRIGTEHYIRLEKKDGIWKIAMEWYKDPFADSINDAVQKDASITNFIVSQTKVPSDTTMERRINAAKYAERYCGIAQEDQQVSCYNKKYVNFNPQGGDCANFGSQILHEGGGFRKTREWNYLNGTGTRAWVNADGFKSYMLRSGRASLLAHGNYKQVYRAAYKMLPGDFVAYGKKGDIVHISVATGSDSKGYTTVSCHNTDRSNVPWDLGWSDKGIEFWLVRMHF